MTTTTRAELVDQARRGDTSAFAELAVGAIDRLNGIAALVLRDPALAEDAVQEALVKCWRQLPKLREVDRFDAWLYRILMSAIADEANRRGRFAANVRVLRAEPSAADASSAIADRDAVEHAFRRLSNAHRAVVVLHQYAGLSLPEAAQALGIPAGTAKSRYHNALASLRAAIEADARLGAIEELPA